MKCAFLVPFFGKLPPYFNFWAKSCEFNHKNFHWFVYNDNVECRHELNPAVTLIPYKFDTMTQDFIEILKIKIPPNLRKVCDYRLMFYFLRKGKEPVDEFDFIGYTDIDMIYGSLMDFLPPDMKRYSIISGDDDAPCGPFTMINRSCMKFLLESENLKKILESLDHHAFDESRELMNLVSAKHPPFCRSLELQPARTKGFNFRKTFSVWENGHISVWDNRGNKKQGGFYHFSRYKNKSRFKIKANPETDNRWGIYKYGITPVSSTWTFYMMRISLLW